MNEMAAQNSVEPKEPGFGKRMGELYGYLGMIHGEMNSFEATMSGPHPEAGETEKPGPDSLERLLAECTSLAAIALGRLRTINSRL